MAERYCVPSSGPCRLSCVGSCATEKKIIKICPYEICDGSNVMLTDSAWPVMPPLPISSPGQLTRRADETHAFWMLKDGLHAPEASAGEDGSLLGLAGRQRGVDGGFRERIARLC